MSWEDVGKLLSVLFVGLGGGVGGKWLLDMYKEWRKGKRQDVSVRATQTRRERADAIEELTEIIDTLRSDLAKVDVKAETALRNERECERKWIRAIEYIQYVTYEANTRGWQLRSFHQEDTDTHPTLPRDVPEDRRRGPDPTRRGPERRLDRQRGGSPDDQQGLVEPHGPPFSDTPPPLPPTSDGEPGE